MPASVVKNIGLVKVFVVGLRYVGAFSHSQCVEVSERDMVGLGKDNCVVHDVKSVLNRSVVDGRL